MIKRLFYSVTYNLLKQIKNKAPAKEEFLSADRHNAVPKFVNAFVSFLALCRRRQASEAVGITLFSWRTAAYCGRKRNSHGGKLFFSSRAASGLLADG